MYFSLSENVFLTPKNALYEMHLAFAVTWRTKVKTKLDTAASVKTECVQDISRMTSCQAR